MSTSLETTYWPISGKPRPYHPSNDLHNNIVKDFPDALRLYLAEHEIEFGNCPLDTTGLDPERVEEIIQCREFLADAKRDVEAGLAVWDHYVREGSGGDLPAMLREAGLDTFAEAVETEDYTGLAI